MTEQELQGRLDFSRRADYAAILAEQEAADRAVLDELEIEYRCSMCATTRVGRQHQTCQGCESDLSQMIRDQRRGY